ncbi:cytoplasmic dynein 1 light intermediate chain 1-like isoform X2 [Acanthaster planci]|uniref:Dynein light intermediate chain n=1 Tax=Acanthaster planci TaxID=133434 RepID=A0A8B7XV84_ACAPL|nr:cytoplasmic dynein 1 light intermediate chain 1-like isoform X2 [Acanthaster planci]
MAPVGEKSGARSSGMENGEDELQNLWSSILGEVSSHSGSKLPSCKNILVLGEDECGKTTLISRLQGADDPKKGHGLEYLYLDVQDEDQDDSTRCGVWILGGEDEHSELLKFALTPASLSHSLAILMVDMSKPWSILDMLNKWAGLLRRHIDTLRMPPERLRELEERLVQQFQEYVEPEEGEDPKSPRRTTAPGTVGGEDEKILLPLGETTLTHNLGIPMVVVVTKSDAISSLEKEHDFKMEHLDFIQQHIRKFCLNYGAALFYTSVKEGKNCDLLYKYLLHRIYSFPFHKPALVVEKDALFVPSGWDNLQKIGILYENMPNINPEEPFGEVIEKPAIRKPLQDSKEVTAEDEQVFLMKQQAMLSKNIPPAKQQESPQRPMGMRTPERKANVASVSPITASGKAKMEPGKPGATNEGVLANFFNSLLSKKTGAGSPGSPASPKPGDKSVRSDAAAELDRMTRGRKSVPGQNSTGAS